MSTESQASHSGFCIALAWPETRCKQAGAWYDGLMRLLRVNRRGYYKVGHAALVLIADEDGHCHYFDFGRYHTPHGHGRVRSALTDHDLMIRIKAKRNGTTLLNTRSILQELFDNPAVHGDGPIHGAVTRVDFDTAFKQATKMQEHDSIPYGPFVQEGTNCSRFVNTVLLAGKTPLFERLKLRAPFRVTPSPIGNLRALNAKNIVVGHGCERVPANSVVSELAHQ